MDSQKVQTHQPSGLSAGLLSREKYWKELSIEEKIERMRTLVKSLVSTNGRLENELYAIKDLIWSHAHEVDGSVVIKISKSERFKFENLNLGSSIKSAMSVDDDKSYI